MKDSGYRVAVIAGSSLVGKELVQVLKERRFPVGQLVAVELVVEEEEAGPLILDLDPSSSAVARVEDLKEEELDFAFLAGRAAADAGLPGFLTGPSATSHCVVIDLSDDAVATRAQAAGKPGDWVLSAPFLDREFPAPDGRPSSKRFISAHPASIMLGGLLLRLAARVPIERAVAQVFQPVSEIGPKAIEELQRQTVNLLSFHKIPEAVFGGQLAFNVLPRLGRSRRGAAVQYRDDLTDLESRIRTQLQAYLAGRVPLPALRLVQAPVFYSLAVSLYLETARAVAPEAIAQALGGERIRVAKFSEQAPSQVNSTGKSDILVDAITADAGHSNGIWLWAAADNMRLAAVNAVEIAEWAGGAMVGRASPGA